MSVSFTFNSCSWKAVLPAGSAHQLYTLSFVQIMQVSDRLKFYLSAAGGGVGLLVTLLFVADVTTLNLNEADRRWEAISSGTLALNDSSLQCWTHACGFALCCAS